MLGLTLWVLVEGYCAARAHVIGGDYGMLLDDSGECMSVEYW